MHHGAASDPLHGPLEVDMPVKSKTTAKAPAKDAKHENAFLKRAAGLSTQAVATGELTVQTTPAPAPNNGGGTTPTPVPSTPVTPATVTPTATPVTPAVSRAVVASTPATTTAAPQTANTTKLAAEKINPTDLYTAGNGQPVTVSISQNGSDYTTFNGGELAAGQYSVKVSQPANVDKGVFGGDLSGDLDKIIGATSWRVDYDQNDTDWSDAANYSTRPLSLKGPNGETATRIEVSSVPLAFKANNLAVVGMASEMQLEGDFAKPVTLTHKDGSKAVPTITLGKDDATRLNQLILAGKSTDSVVGGDTIIYNPERVAGVTLNPNGDGASIVSTGNQQTHLYFQGEKPSVVKGALQGITTVTGAASLLGGSRDALAVYAEDTPAMLATVIVPFAGLLTLPTAQSVSAADYGVKISNGTQVLSNIDGTVTFAGGTVKQTKTADGQVNLYFTDHFRSVVVVFLYTFDYSVNCVNVL
ncbi:hypothetical protein H7R52_12090 [Weissella confusa]|uniref:Uncharacterized protein n=1 Tax=Weissella confusa TaxID=1583 RepID=A0A923NG07_WEICO|nr:hypothetical protein [Weissella confusa]